MKICAYIIASILLFVCAIGATPVAPETSSLWTTSMVAGARTIYDSNVFLQNRSPIIAPNGMPARAGSLVESVSLSLGAAWKPSSAFAFDAGYSPELTHYQRFNSENHNDHRFTTGLLGQNEAWSYDLKGNLLIVDGSSESPIFDHLGGGPAVGGEPVRSRHDQTITKVTGKITYALCPKAFIRAVGSACFQDFGTTQKPTTGPGSTPGYANYVDRSEWSAGADAGWFARKDLALVTGIRVGEQRQANLLGIKNNYSNTLTRFLIGVEGNILPKLSLSILAGPDMRHYTDSVAATGFNHNPTTYYAEATAIWTPAKNDSMSFSMKDFLWLPGGIGAYESTAYDLRWTHTFTQIWSTNLGFNLQGADNTDYAVLAKQCDDVIYTTTIGTTYTLNTKTKLDLGVSHEWSDSFVANTPGREYTRWLVSAGVKYTF